MIGNTDPKCPRIAAWVIGVGTALLVCGYLTADQWLSLVKGLL
jgi:hypothetical protein